MSSSAETSPNVKPANNMFELFAETNVQELKTEEVKAETVDRTQDVLAEIGLADQNQAEIGQVEQISAEQNHLRPVGDDGELPLTTTRMGRKRLMVDTSWQDMANCLGVDADLFFPERGASTREAKEVCRGCVVKDDCLEFALINGEKFGIWGGMSERERRRIRRKRALERQEAIAVASETA